MCRISIALLLLEILRHVRASFCWLLRKHFRLRGGGSCAGSLVAWRLIRLLCANVSTPFRRRDRDGAGIIGGDVRVLFVLCDLNLVELIMSPGGSSGSSLILVI